jgi:hypothetical protein
MRGHDLSWQSCSWTTDEFMEMLLANDGRRYPQVWVSTFVTGFLPVQVRMLRHVTEWLQSYALHGRPMRVTIVRYDQCLSLRYEEWVLWEPGRREERVLAYRAHPEGVCACCQKPAFWKLPRGRRGCAAHIVRSVAPTLFWAPWGQMTRVLSRSKASRFEEMLSHDWFNVAVFQVCFLDQDCLSCSCGDCTLKDLRAGVLCPVDQDYVDFELAGPDSPREPADPLVPEEGEAAELASFDVRAREAHRQL